MKDKYLNPGGVSELWQKVKTALGAKQDKLTGAAGQVVGFGADGNAAAVHGWSNRNLLDNWYWAHRDAIINQQGQTEYAGRKYTIDRWKLAGGTNLTVNDGTITINGATEGETWLFQLMENPVCKNETVTASLLITEMTAPGTGFIILHNKGIYTRIPNGTTGLFSFTVKLDSDGANQFRIVAGPNTNLTIKAAKLELGSVQTLAHQDASGNWVLNDPPPDKALELLKCQRYQIVSTEISSPYCGTAITGSIISGPNVFPTTMRITPVPINVRIRNLTTTDVFEAQVINLWGTPLGFSAIEISASSPLTLGSWYQIIAIFDANL